MNSLANVAQRRRVKAVSNIVVDASAVLAVILAEKGADIVIPMLSGAFLSCINLAEVTTRALDLGRPLEDTLHDIARLPLRVVEFDAGQAHITASLRAATKPFGLSLGDRACLALGVSRQALVLTGDSDWRKLKIGVEIVVFR
jgi:ribonuclease VapC